MKFADAITIMRDTLNKHERHAPNPNFGSSFDWSIEYRSNVKYLGRCIYHTKVIVLNKEFAEMGPYEEVFDTLLHECAHALCGIEISPKGNRMAHGKVWKSWARRLGCRPMATVATHKLGEYGEEMAAKRIANPKKWAVVVDRGDRLVKVHEAGRRIKNLERKGVIGDKSTHGKLWMVDHKLFNHHNGDRTKLLRHLTR